MAKGRQTHGRIAIFGGAFDPITLGHQKVAEVVAEKLDAMVIFIPVKKHRWGKEMTAAEYRLSMCHLAKHAVNGRCETSSYDINHEFNGSMFAAMQSFEREPIIGDDTEFHLIIGADNADTVHLWDRGPELMKKYPFAVTGRQVKPQTDWFLHDPHHFFELDIECSSTKAREALKAQNYELAATYLNPKVFDFIRLKNLYS